jgi:hypothetical protein
MLLIASPWFMAMAAILKVPIKATEIQIKNGKTDCLKFMTSK